MGAELGRLPGLDATHCPRGHPPRVAHQKKHNPPGLTAAAVPESPSLEETPPA